MTSSLADFAQGNKYSYIRFSDHAVIKFRLAHSSWECCLDKTSALQEVELEESHVCGCPVDEDPSNQDEDDPPQHSSTAAAEYPVC